ncbi:hypothetical protein QAD02_002474 [Eretmocerus hayati]|uniref:Uncharacterized protein n=1 Tax=Eretmocerus hayati TaxID=131215 RepID=A0ACC2NJ10_9HYME|nr:hypothetical protein QAD02_002474 [Eretmocerus hayati]
MKSAAKEKYAQMRRAQTGNDVETAVDIDNETSKILNIVGIEHAFGLPIVPELGLLHRNTKKFGTITYELGDSVRNGLHWACPPIVKCPTHLTQPRQTDHGHGQKLPETLHHSSNTSGTVSSHAAQSAKRERLEYHRHGTAAGPSSTNPRLLQRSSETSKPTSSRTDRLTKQEPSLGSRKYSSVADAANVVPRPVQLPVIPLSQKQREILIYRSKSLLLVDEGTLKFDRSAKRKLSLGGQNNASAAGPAVVMPSPMQLTSKTSISTSVRTARPLKSEPYATGRRNGSDAGTAIVMPRPMQLRSNTSNSKSAKNAHPIPEQVASFGGRRNKCVAGAAAVVPRPLQLSIKISISTPAKAARPLKSEPLATGRRNGSNAGTAIVMPRPMQLPSNASIATSATTVCPSKRELSLEGRQNGSAASAAIMMTKPMQLPSKTSMSTSARTNRPAKRKLSLEGRQTALLLVLRLRCRSRCSDPARPPPQSRRKLITIVLKNVRVLIHVLRFFVPVFNKWA